MTTLQNFPLSVLVATNDEPVSQPLRFMLLREKYTVRLARDGRKAKQLIEQIIPKISCGTT